MKYILTPTEEGLRRGKKRLELDTLRKAQFAMAINPGCFNLTKE